MSPNRRQAILGILAGAAASPLAGQVAKGQGLPDALMPTPSCGDNDEPTVAQTEGPYFTPNSPLKQDFTGDGATGKRLMIGGLVLDTACNPIPAAMIELWHADAAGSYDNKGSRYRGHSLSDEQGRWWFATIVPGLYPGRTRHYHLKVQRPRGEMLTTQLYFPGEPQNERDRIFDDRLLLRLEPAGGERYGLYSFVLA
ncbi:MAG: intradiol ring-cleavage dioxygenase [Hyphomicrobiales bacterium]|nr:intradiol ring-cleavage dioxygenase [Hyphomicrobiales bacterium]